MDRQMDRWIDGQMDRQLDGGQMDRQLDGGQIDRQQTYINRWIDRQIIEIHRQIDVYRLV